VLTSGARHPVVSCLLPQVALNIQPGHSCTIKNLVELDEKERVPILGLPGQYFLLCASQLPNALGVVLEGHPPSGQ
jgi:hypothetical protein